MADLARAAVLGGERVPATDSGKAPNGDLRWLAALAWGVERIGRITPIRRALLRLAERELRARCARPQASLRHVPAVTQDGLAMALAVLEATERAFAEHSLGASAIRGLVEVLVAGNLIGNGDDREKRRFRRAHGQSPPNFLTISPSRACNLRCSGCYAASGATPERLEWDVLDHIVSDAKRHWGSRMFVLSGGEPLAYRDDGRGVLDLAAKHSDCFFLMYTNGTLIDNTVARRMGHLGNLSPALSIEGLRERTDARRGSGVFDRVVEAMRRLRTHGVMFGVSLTATRENADEILADEVVEFIFGEMRAFYGWIFQYMPIGRSFTLELMPTPEQRLRLWKRTWRLVRERRLFLVDFWNSGSASDGCLAAGRAGGYLHVNWNGDVSPCVFVPYAPVNVYDIWSRGGTMTNAWQSPFFAEIRKWQREYGFRESDEPRGECGNWLAPCPIRDHHGTLRELVRKLKPRPTDADAEAALADPDYGRGLEEYGARIADLTSPIWKEEYLDPAGGRAIVQDGPDQVHEELRGN